MDDKSSQDEELRQAIDFFFKHAGPQFVQFLGFSIDSTDFDSGVITFDMDNRLVGNRYYRMLHGGVISSIMDIAGGVTVYLQVMKEFRGKDHEKQVERLSKIGTIDIRVDFLSPGRGERFTARGYMLRKGGKVAVTRMELRNEEDVLIAVATGTYAVG
jgi:uncharacterized protein (TIGR00369 family)